MTTIEKEQTLLDEILKELFNCYRATEYITSREAKNPSKLIRRVIKLLYANSKKIVSARRDAAKLREKEVARLLILAYKNSESAHAVLWDLMRGKLREEREEKIRHMTPKESDEYYELHYEEDYEYHVSKAKGYLEKAIYEVKRAIGYHERLADSKAA